MLPHSYATLPHLSRQNSPRSRQRARSPTRRPLRRRRARSAWAAAHIGMQRRAAASGRSVGCGRRRGCGSADRGGSATAGELGQATGGSRASLRRVAGVARHIKKPLPEARAAALSEKLRLRISGGAWRRRGACCSMSSWSAWRCGASSSSCASICERA